MALNFVYICVCVILTYIGQYDLRDKLDEMYIYAPQTYTHKCQY